MMPTGQPPPSYGRRPEQRAPWQGPLTVVTNVAYVCIRNHPVHHLSVVHTSASSSPFLFLTPLAAFVHLALGQQDSPANLERIE